MPNPRIKPALIAKLQSSTGLTDLVGLRILPQKGDQSEPRPYLLYSRDATERKRHLAGSAALTRCEARLECWGDTERDADRVAEQVRQALDEERGPWGDVFVQASHVFDEVDDFEAPAFADDVGGHVARLVVEVWYSETAPA
jgi:Protein of unknown function (DUF3168)